MSDSGIPEFVIGVIAGVLASACGVVSFIVVKAVLGEM